MSGERRVVLDASAMLAWALGERGATTIGKVLPYAIIPAPNLVEVLYRAPERGHRMRAPELYSHITAMGTAVEAVGPSDVLRATELIALSRAARRDAADSCLSLADGVCLAVAERLALPVTGGDQLWETLALKVKYLPFRR